MIWVGNIEIHSNLNVLLDGLYIYQENILNVILTEAITTLAASENILSIRYGTSLFGHLLLIER